MGEATELVGSGGYFPEDARDVRAINPKGAGSKDIKGAIKTGVTSIEKNPKPHKEGAPPAVWPAGLPLDWVRCLLSDPRYCFTPYQAMPSCLQPELASI
jgi:hypothetical protein